VKLADHRSWLAGAVALSVVAAGATVATSAQAAATDCQVTYSVSSQWSGGFGANVDVTNASWNGALGTGGTASFGFNGSSGGANPVPTGFALNGVPCTGDTTGGGTTTPPPPTTTAPAGRSLPSSFRWSSSGALIAPKSDATHSLVAVKDSSVVHFNGRWHMFASTVNASGNYSMEYLNFTDWSQAAAAPQSYLDQTAIGTGYKTAPQVFFFAPQKLWYLVYQTGSNASYSTNTDIGNPAGWSAPHNFYSGMPAIIQQNIGSGFWVDFWVICDRANCYLFSADDNGHIYRSQTTLANFPNGFGDGSNTVIAASDANRFNLFEAENVYKVDGSNTYLLIVEAIGSDGHRQFRSWTSPSLTGSWTPLTATQANPFAAASNITFTGTPWTQDISSGEAIRSGVNQNLTISPCHLQYAYQGVAPSSAGLPYNSLPWRIGLLTQTNPAC
jgi:endo-1,4-beta-xylanase